MHCRELSYVDIRCSDVYDNAGGDWVGVDCIEDQQGIQDNICEDPLFCGAAVGDFTLDAESPCAPYYNPDCLLIGAWPVGCGFSIFTVHPEGTGDYPTIQAAIDAASNADIIELTDGVFQGDGNRDIDYCGKSITVRSQSLDPSMCIIDVEGSPIAYHRGFRFHTGEFSESILEGVAVTGGYIGSLSPERIGAAIYCQKCFTTTDRLQLYRQHCRKGWWTRLRSGRIPNNHRLRVSW